MAATVVQLLLALLLVAAATPAGRRWGDGTAGPRERVPGDVGPVLLLDAHAHGSAFAADAAAGTLIGLVALAGFVVAYAHAAARAPWPAALAVAWLAAAGSLALALLALPHVPGAGRISAVPQPGWELPARMVIVVATHRRHGAPAVAALLRGMVLGMGVFCGAFALLARPAGAGAAFVVSGAGAVATQVLAHSRRSPVLMGGVAHSHGRT